MARSTKLLIPPLIAVLAGYLLGPQPSRAQGASPQGADPRTACAADVQKLCANVAPGGGRVLACLKQHKEEVSDGCKQAVLAALGSQPGATSAAPSPTPAKSALPGAPAVLPAASLNKPASPTKTAPASGTEKFAERIVPDADHGNMRAVTLLIPEKWHFESKLEWHYNWTEYPLSYSAHAENPDNGEAYFQYPLLRLESTEVAPALRQYDRSKKLQPGERMPLGSIYFPPQPPVQALATFIKTVRSNVSNLKWIGTQDLPDLANALHLDPGTKNQHGLAVKIGYDLNGQPFEEAFFGVYYISQGGSDAVSVGQMHMNAGMVQQTNWGFVGLQSFRAPAGTLEKRMPVFCLIAKSLFVNPQWGRLAKAIDDKLVADFNQKIKQGYDQLRAAQAVMEQTMKQQAAFQAEFDKREEAFRNSKGIDDSYLRSGGGGDPDTDSYLRDGGKRSAFDHMSDLIRGVDTLEDPENGGGTKQLSNLGQYHFTDGFGNYRTYDDPNMTPEKAGEVGTWQPMTPVP